MSITLIIGSFITNKHTVLFALHNLISQFSNNLNENTLNIEDYNVKHCLFSYAKIRRKLSTTDITYSQNIYFQTTLHERNINILNALYLLPLRFTQTCISQR